MSSRIHIANNKWRGYYYDGKSARRRSASIEILSDSINLTLEDGTSLALPIKELRQTQGAFKGEPVRLERNGEAIIVEDIRFIAALRSIAPRYASSFSDGGIRRNPAVLWTSIAVGSITFLIFAYFWGIPAAAGALANKMPLSWEEKLGELVLKDFTSQFSTCENEETLKAVNSIMDKLNKSALSHPYTIKVKIVSSPVINAFAAPGGYIVVFTGLIDAAKTPDELAAVLAHELQHVINRHATKALISGLSSYALLSLVFGDVQIIANLTAMLTNMSYSRDLEREADNRAIELLSKAQIDPIAMKSFFETMNNKYGDIDSSFTYLSSHPLTEDRIKNVEEKSALLKNQYLPLIPGTNWDSVKSLCPLLGRRRH